MDMSVSSSSQPLPEVEWIRSGEAELRFAYSRNHLHRLAKAGAIRIELGDNNEIWFDAASIAVYKERMDQLGNSRYNPRKSSQNQGLMARFMALREPGVPTLETTAAIDDADDFVDYPPPAPCSMVGRYHLTDSLDSLVGSLPVPIVITAHELSFQAAQDLCRMGTLTQNFASPERARLITRHLGIRRMDTGRELNTVSHGDTIILVTPAPSGKHQPGGTPALSYKLLRTAI